MAARARALFVVVVAGGAALAACGRSAEQRRVGELATAEAEQQASESTLTGATIVRTTEMGDRTGASREAVRAERSVYRARLENALDGLDGKRRDAKPRGAAHVKAIDARRELLRRDLDALDRTTDHEWAALRAKIDRDLREHAPGE